MSILSEDMKRVIREQRLGYVATVCNVTMHPCRRSESRDQATHKDEFVTETEIQEAAVLIPIYRHEDGALRLVLVRRGKRGIHGSQIAFPGGKREPEDSSLLDTALREAWEEIGITADRIEILAALPIVQTQTTGIQIHPFLARITPPDRWRGQEGEIDAVLELKVQNLLATQGEDTVHFPTWPEPKPIEFYGVGQERIWGVTYRILQPLLSRLLLGEWEI